MRALLSLTALGSDWETINWGFTATSAATTFDLRSSLSTRSRNPGVGQMNVRLISVQDPGSVPELGVLALVGLALLMAGAARVRRAQRMPTDQAL